MQQTISITVKGKVQGVFYRQSAHDAAESIGITGTVRNLEDGSVQLEATGTQEQLDRLLAWCRKGPPRAIVDSVEWEPAAAKQFRGFTVIRGR